MNANIWRGAFSIAAIDTSPGGAGPFAPLPDWEGDNDAYVALMRRRYRCRDAGQQMNVVARWAASVAVDGAIIDLGSGEILRESPRCVAFSGPFAAVAAGILVKLKWNGCEGNAR